jgi:MFS family permease
MSKTKSRLSKLQGMRGFGLDLSLLRRVRDFRLLFSSGLVSGLGSMITYVALPYQVKEITGSYVAVGLMGAAELVPLIVFGLYGGVLADYVDRRKLILIGESTALGLSIILLINSQLENPRLWVLYLVGGAFAGVNGLRGPSMAAVIPRIVSHEDLPAASAIMGLRYQIPVIAGPAIGGIIISIWGVTPAFLIDVISYALSLMLLLQVSRMPRSEKATPPSIGALFEGVKYASSRQDLMGTYLIDLAAMFFAMPTALFPFWADQLNSPQSLGFLYSAGTVGALLITLTSKWTLKVHRHGRAIIFAALIWGLSITISAIFNNVYWVLLCLVAAGAADQVSVIFRATIWNQTIPDELRGRLAGIELLSYAVGPIGGQMRAGGMAAVTGLNGAVIGGGLLCVASVSALTSVLPKFRKYDARTDPYAVSEREIRAARALSELKTERSPDEK